MKYMLQIFGNITRDQFAGWVNDYIASLDDQTEADSRTLLDIMRRITGQEPQLWNVGTIGFGTYHYKYDSGREGDTFVVGFSPRASALTLYGLLGAPGAEELFAKLGPHKAGKGCLYVTTLAKVDEQVLRDLVAAAWAGWENDEDGNEGG